MIRGLHAGKRQSAGFSLNVFSDDELYEIHLATLEVLEKMGVFAERTSAFVLTRVPARLMGARRHRWVPLS